MKPTLTLLTALLLAPLAVLHSEDTIPVVTLESRGLPRVLFNNDSDDLKFSAFPETHGALWVPAGELLPRHGIASLDDYLAYRIGPLAKTAATGLSYCGNFGAPIWELRRDPIAALGEDPLQPKEFFLDACWVTDNGTVSKPPLPLRIHAGESASAALFITDDPAQAAGLQLELAWKCSGEFAAPEFLINGHQPEELKLDRGKASFVAVSASRLEKGDTSLTVSCSSASLAKLLRRGTNEFVFRSKDGATLTALGLKMTPPANQHTPTLK